MDRETCCHLHAFNKFCKENCISYEVNTSNELIGLAVDGVDFNVYDDDNETIEMGTEKAYIYVMAWHCCGEE